MPEKYLNAIKHSLKNVAPSDGIAYLLYRIDQDFWIPIVTSSDVLSNINYYRLSYTFDFLSPHANGPALINDEISDLVYRGKIETITIGAPFYQEIISLGTTTPELVVIRSSKQKFSELSNDAVRMSESLYELCHLLWGKDALRAKIDNENICQTLTYDDIISNAVDFLSNEHPFPPYFLHTDYIIKLSRNKNDYVQHIYSNPLGYSYWIHKKLALTPPPWVFEMAKKESCYCEDIINPATPELKLQYENALGYDVLAVQLANQLYDDVLLIAYTLGGSLDNTTVKLWARHNKPRNCQSRSKSHNPRGFDKPCDALRELLTYSYEKSISDDYLVVSWVTWLDDCEEPRALHVSCDASLNNLFSESDLGEFGSGTKYPPSADQSSKYLMVNHRSTDIVNENITNDIYTVLKHSYELWIRENPAHAILSFWSRITSGGKYYSQVMFPRGAEDRHETYSDFWHGPLENILPFMERLMEDLKPISHLGKCTEFKSYNDELRNSYLHIAKAFKVYGIAAELLKFIMGEANIKANASLEAITVGKENGWKLLEAFYILRNDGDGWKLERFHLEDGIFYVTLIKVVNDVSALSIASNAFDNSQSSVESKDTDALGELKYSCSILRLLANKFGVSIRDNNTVLISAEFNGKGGN